MVVDNSSQEFQMIPLLLTIKLQKTDLNHTKILVHALPPVKCICVKYLNNIV
jgi:hypothetical protein